jgi:hypothetical protein
MNLKTLLPEPNHTSLHPLTLFALLNLGIIEALANGLMTATDAVRTVYHADNCLFVRQRLRDKIADRIMSHGVQLPDLFTALSSEEAQREFQRELATMRALCLILLESKRLVA